MVQKATFLGDTNLPGDLGHSHVETSSSTSKTRDERQWSRGARGTVKSECMEIQRIMAGVDGRRFCAHTIL